MVRQPYFTQADGVVSLRLGTHQRGPVEVSKPATGWLIIPVHQTVLDAVCAVGVQCCAKSHRRHLSGSVGVQAVPVPPESGSSALGSSGLGGVTPRAAQPRSRALLCGIVPAEATEKIFSTFKLCVFL